MLLASLVLPPIGVMDWVLFNNGMESRGYSENLRLWAALTPCSAD